MQPKYLGFLILTYCMLMVFSNWFDPRLIDLFGLNTDAGTLIFPLGFLISDLITEVYGYKQARRAIWCGFLFNFLFLLYGQLVIHLPSPSYAVFNQNFDLILSMNARIILGSLLSYFTSEPLNAYLMARLKIKTKGRYVSLRLVLSTFISSGLDSAIFSFIAFYKIIPNQDLLFFILTMWLIKIIIEILGLPLSTYLIKKLKQKERLDIYDTQTKFNLFSLEAKYKKSDNCFK